MIARFLLMELFHTGLLRTQRVVSLLKVFLNHKIALSKIDARSKIALRYVCGMQHCIADRGKRTMETVFSPKKSSRELLNKTNKYCYRYYHTSYLIPHTSYLIHHTSYIIHHTSYHIPHTTYHIPHTTYYTEGGC